MAAIFKASLIGFSTVIGHAYHWPAARPGLLKKEAPSSHAMLQKKRSLSMERVSRVYGILLGRDFQAFDMPWLPCRL